MSRFVFPKAVKELRFFLSQTGDASVPLRNFLVQNYAHMKKANPETAILIREAYGITPSLTSRFEKGREVKVGLDGLGMEEISQKFPEFLK